MGKGWCGIDPPQRTRSYFWGFLRLCQFLVKIDKKNATMRVLADGQIH